MREDTYNFHIYVVKLLSCVWLLRPNGYSPPDSSVYGISRARILEWVAISFSWGSSWPRDWTHVPCIGRQILYYWDTREAQIYVCVCVCVKYIKVWKKVKSLSCVQLFATPRTVAYQAPQSMEFSRQEYWSGLPFPSLGDLPNPGIKPRSPALQADALPSEPPGKPLKFM